MSSPFDFLALPHLIHSEIFKKLNVEDRSTLRLVSSSMSAMCDDHRNVSYEGKEQLRIDVWKYTDVRKSMNIKFAGEEMSIPIDVWDPVAHPDSLVRALDRLIELQGNSVTHLYLLASDRAELEFFFLPYMFDKMRAMPRLRDVTLHDIDFLDDDAYAAVSALPQNISLILSLNRPRFYEDNNKWLSLFGHLKSLTIECWTHDFLASDYADVLSALPYRLEALHIDCQIFNIDEVASLCALCDHIHLTTFPGFTHYEHRQHPPRQLRLLAGDAHGCALPSRADPIPRFQGVFR